MESNFQFELCSYPPATSTCWCYLGKLTQNPSDNLDSMQPVQYVLDGSALIHRVLWPKGAASYREICLMYCDYVRKKYGNAIIVFDGYSGPSTKDTAQRRRTKGKIRPSVTFYETQVTIRKEQFLFNSQNKQSLIEMLCQYLECSKLLVTPCCRWCWFDDSADSNWISSQNEHCSHWGWHRFTHSFVLSCTVRCIWSIFQTRA